MHQVNIEEAKNRLPSLIQQVIQGEEIVITMDDKPVAKLVSVSATKPQPQFGSARGLITMSDDFDEPLDDFKEYME
jgi:prevent-host-death family protein